MQRAHRTGALLQGAGAPCKPRLTNILRPQRTCAGAFSFTLRHRVTVHATDAISKAVFGIEWTDHAASQKSDEQIRRSAPAR